MEVVYCVASYTNNVDSLMYVIPLLVFPYIPCNIKPRAMYVSTNIEAC